MRQRSRRATYYRSEAARVTALADATPSNRGHGGFAAAAQEYRNLADAFDRVEAAEEPLLLGAPVMRWAEAPRQGS